MSDEIKVADKYIIRKDLLYTSQHEWVKNAGEVYIYGISDFAQKELGELAYIEFPDVGSTFSKGDTMGSIEALKTVADYYAPFDCEVVEVNSTLEDETELINESPYDKGWILKIKPTNGVEGLLTPEDYAKLIEKEIQQS